MDLGEVLQEVLCLILLAVHMMTVKPWNHLRPKGSDSEWPVLAVHQAGSSSFALRGLG